MPKVACFLPPGLFERNKWKFLQGGILSLPGPWRKERLLRACKDADFLMVTAANPLITAQNNSKYTPSRMLTASVWDRV